MICKNCELSIRVADTEESRRKGLSGTRELGETEGLLIDFGHDENVSLWMPDMNYDLSVAFITEEGIIADIQDMFKDEPTTLHHSKIPVRYALEVNRGLFQQHRIDIGDTISL